MADKFNFSKYFFDYPDKEPKKYGQYKWQNNRLCINTNHNSSYDNQKNINFLTGFHNGRIRANKIRMICNILDDTENHFEMP